MKSYEEYMAWKLARRNYADSGAALRLGNLEGQH